MNNLIFRAFDKKENCWINGFSIHNSGLFSDMIKGEINNSGSCIAECNWIDINKIEDIEINQYTGLKDHKGNEIYEGDIVVGTSRIQEDWRPLQKVHFLNGCFMFGNWNSHEYFNKHSEIEIVGNVYQNPELLEENQ